MKPRPTRIYRKKGCEYCKNGTVPSFKNNENIIKYITERGKIISRAKTGICAAHQRKLTIAIKRARILALLPFAPRI